MTFNSVHFLLFFPLVAGVYFSLPHRFRWALLLSASCYFYMVFLPVYILILAFTIVIDYLAGIGIERSQGGRRKALLLASLVANVGILVVFKYLGFLESNVAAVAKLLHWNYGLKTLDIVLPIGLSFHTFQAMSYTIEVYRGNQRAERHFGIYALYVMFFPQLVAGPIERPQNLLHQFHEPHTPDAARSVSALRLILFGLFQKVFLADRIAAFVNPVFLEGANNNPSILLLATVGFAFQIYYDFAGYSNIAVGAAQFLGFKLMRNFRTPYASASIGEFWKRWHISLSSWFRDYVYLPLGGSRVSSTRRALNVLTVFLLSGLWHGANWTYIIWGGLHGFYYVVSIATHGLRARVNEALGLARFPRLHHAMRVAMTFALVCLTWIFFRAESVGAAFQILNAIVLGFFQRFDYPAFHTRLLGSGIYITLAGLIPFMIFEGFQDAGSESPWNVLERVPVWVRWGVYATCALAMMDYGIINDAPFIYFQF